MARLIIRSGGQPEQTVELGGDAVTIGREPGNTVVLPGESKASRRHCQIAPLAASGAGGGGWELIDLQSTNGTRVNGQAIKRQRLMPGDVIDIGLTKIHFEDAAAAAAREATPNVCYVEYTAGTRRGERVALSAPRTTLGRRETNTIVLDDRMASGHHAEIVRDLNGYTIRDLGSTNGTLVNGEPVTELLLVHGARIRVGNARLVFKDPTMKDVEVALAGLDEDDGGWGMMADVDLTKVRRGGMGSLVGALAVVALAVGGYVLFVANRSSGATAQVDADAANWIQDPHFEAADLPWWSVDEGSPATIERSASGGQKGSAALLVRHDPTKAAGGAGVATGLGVAHYNADLQISESSAYRVGAAIKKEGPGRGELGIQWIRLANAKSGSTAVTQTTRLASAGAACATGIPVVRRPRWAESGRLVVVAGPETTVRVDDVRFEPADGETGGGRLDAGDVEGSLTSAGTLAFARTATVLAVGAAPFAKLPDGRTVGGPSAFVAESVPNAAGDSVSVSGKLLDEKGEAVAGSVTWSKTAEGLSASVSVPGAASVGLALDVPIAHLEDGIGVLGSFGSRKLPAEAGASVDGARKALLGDPHARGARPPTLFALASPTGDVLRVETVASDDVDLLRVRAAANGATAEVRLVTGFASEHALAIQHLRDAELKADTSVGEAIQDLQRVAQEFPFEEQVRGQALAKAQALQERTRSDLKALDDVAVRFSVLGSEDALVELEKRAADLAKQFPADRASAGTLEQTVAAQIAAARAARWKFDADRAGPEIRRLQKLAALLEQERGFEVEAAAYYDSIVRRFERLASEQPDSDVGRQVDDARKKRDELLAKPEVRASWPGEPVAGGGAPVGGTGTGTNTRTSTPFPSPERQAPDPATSGKPRSPK